MTRTQQIVGGSVLGFAAISGALLFTGGESSQAMSCNCADLPAGTAQATGTVICPNTTEVQTVDLGTLTFPRETIEFSVPDGCTLRLNPIILNGQTFYGVGSHYAAAAIPEPTVTATPTPTISPDPQPILQVPAPVLTTAPQGEKVQSGKDAAGNDWSLAWLWLMRNGDYALPGQGSVMGAQADHLVFVDGELVSHEPRDGNYYRWPVIVPSPTPEPTPTSTPTPTPTVTPTPTPTPVVAAPVITLRSCSASLTAAKPATATGTNWRVQYFDGETAMTTASTTITRTVTLQPRAYSVTAKWTKSGQPTLTSHVTVTECQAR
jgi:hypothetical protein